MSRNDQIFSMFTHHVDGWESPDTLEEWFLHYSFFICENLYMLFVVVATTPSKILAYIQILEPILILQAIVSSSYSHSM